MLELKGGGSELAALAEMGDPDKVQLPVPMEQRLDCHFSFR